MQKSRRRWTLAASGIGWLVLVGSLSGGPVGLASVLPALAAAAPLLAGFWASAWGVGRALGGREPAGALALGAAAVLLAGWLVAWGVGVHRLTAVAVVLPGWGLAAWRIRGWRIRGWRARRPERRSAGWGPLLLAPGAALLAVAACVPPGGIWRVEAFGYDTLSYHLQIPREWLAAGGMAELEHNVYAYLPGLIENAFALAMAGLGTDPAAGPLGADRAAAAAVPCQLLHASFAAVAALCVREAVGRRGVAGWAAAGALLAVPWVVVTGSSAYNEMAAVCFGAAALGLVASDRGGGATLRGAQVGLLLGAACLAKPTAGFLLALPLGGWMLGRAFLDPRNRAGSRGVGGAIARRRRSVALRAAAVAAAVGFAVLCPWFVRNAAWTGNPVFPFATGAFGAGHWTPELAGRWAAAHAPPADADPAALWRQWLGNRGFGAVGGAPAVATATEVARFGREGGFPVFWVAAAAGVALGLRARRTRGPAAGLLWLLGFQLAAWWLFTHHQSRFLVFTALPGAVAVGLLAGGVSRSRGGWESRGIRGWVVAAPVVGVTAAVAASVLGAQTRRVPDPVTGEPVAPALWAWAQSLSSPGFDGLDAHPVDALPPGSRVLIVADNGGLLYADTPLAYASAFDANPLAGWVGRAGGGPAAGLRGAGFTHLLLGWSELDRLGASYGVDPRLDPERLERLTRGWPGERPGPWSLLAVPPAK